MDYFLYFLLSTALAVICTPLIRFFAIRYQIVDKPTLARKIHTKPVALLGGMAILISFSLVVGLFLLWQGSDFQLIPQKFFFVVFIAMILLSIGGFLDDYFSLPAKLTWVFPSLACFICVFFGIGVDIKHLSNPFGGIIPIDSSFFGVQLSAIFAFLWLIGMTYTTKIMDGMDGLVSGVGFIGSLVVFFLSLTPNVNQPITAVLAIILAGAILGFLFYNFNPASIFLGEAGSTLIGFLLGVLSIIAGGKIATALLVFGIPILDVAWAIVRRLISGQSPFQGDRKHLHYRLLDIGLTQKQAVFTLWAISAIFGSLAIFLQSLGKLVALFALFILMLLMLVLLVTVYNKKRLIKK